MKRLLFLVFMAFSFTSFSQKLHFGAKGGWNYTNITGMPDEWEDVKFENSSSYHLGGYVNFEITDHFSLQPELLFSGKGSVISIQDSSGTVESDLDLNYLTVPVVLQYRNGMLSIHGGAEMGFQLSGDSSDDRYTLTDPDLWDQRFDLSLIGGLSFHLGNLFITARYGRSMTDLVEFKTTGPDGRVTGEGSYGTLEFWQLSVGLQLF